MLRLRRYFGFTPPTDRVEPARARIRAAREAHIRAEHAETPIFASLVLAGGWPDFAEIDRAVAA